MKRILISFVLCAAFFISAKSQTTVNPKLGKDPVKKVVAAMTLEEKAGLVVGTGMRFPGGPPPTGGRSPECSCHT